MGSIEGFASSALSVTISLFFSILFAAPLIRKAFATDDPLAECMALILAAAFSLLILILLTALVESLPFAPATTILLWLISLTVEYLLINPTLTLWSWYVVGKRAIFVRSGGNGGVDPTNAVGPVSPAPTGDEPSTSRSSSRTPRSTSQPPPLAAIRPTPVAFIEAFAGPSEFDSDSDDLVIEYNRPSIGQGRQRGGATVRGVSSPPGGANRTRTLPPLPGPRTIGPRTNRRASDAVLFEMSASLTLQDDIDIDLGASGHWSD